MKQLSAPKLESMLDRGQIIYTKETNQHVVPSN